MATDRVNRLPDHEQEAVQARQIAMRYRCEFVDLREEHIDHDLFHSVPVDLMFRYNFVPLNASNGSLEIALADPRNLNLIDELSILLQKKLRVKVATPISRFVRLSLGATFAQATAHEKRHIEQARRVRQRGETGDGVDGEHRLSRQERQRQEVGTADERG